MNIPSFTKTYQGRQVLSVPALTVSSGKIYALIGPNGSGKSTFAKIIAGQETDDRKQSVLPDFKGSIGYLPQHPYAFHMSLEKNLLQNAPGNHERAQSLLQSLDLISLRKKNAATLSGGESARMALARLFMKKYDLIILDEPCAAMDIHSIDKAQNLIMEYQKETGCTLFIITHSLKQAKQISDETFFFCDGRLVEYGSTDQIFSSPNEKETIHFLF